MAGIALTVCASNAVALPNYQEDRANPALVVLIIPDLTVTGLTWRRCAIGQQVDASSSTRTCTGNPTAMTLAEAKAAITAANTAQLDGKTDWRLPTYNELGALLAAEYVSPPNYETDAFPNLKTDLPYFGKGPFDFLGVAASINLGSRAIDLNQTPPSGYLLMVSGNNQPQFQVELVADVNGSISGNSTQLSVAKNSVTFEVIPEQGYILSGTSVTSGNCLPAPVPFTNKIGVIVGTGDCNVTATFARNPLMKLLSSTVTPPNSGTVTCDPGNWVDILSNPSCTATPAAGYELTSLMCDTAAAPADSCTFNQINEDHTISAVFSKKAVPAAATPVPTLREWALILLSTALAAVAALCLRRSRVHYS